ncbi:unnamed protein product [Clonostachys byssicola]|uniref:Uncharacterized protein n=1 Tax=Clonostachys byssicola TaxID=160290 RepID=A0A9N9USA8_9HYPO|nr:unnamed protein product [Clonostachys byssicola]
MSSRSGSYSRRPHPRQRESPLDRHRSRPDSNPNSYVPGVDIITNPPLPPSHPSRSANAARRAERIRNIDEYSGFQRAPDQSSNYEQNLHTNSAHIDSLWATFDELEQASDLTNLQLRDLLDLTNHNTMSHTLPPGNASPLPRSFDPPDDNRRNKRRKIDADRLAPTISRIRYGKYGSVEPGALRMEILSCDGGSYASSNPSSYVAENLLRNDETVYCTKGNRCNVVLRHEGGAPFTLHELVIKGPTSVNYSHPIREGMVFVAMRQDEVLTRTAQYQIQYSQRDPLATTPEREDPTVRPGRYGRDPIPMARFRRSQANGSEDEGYRMAQMPPEFSTIIPEFGVTTLCNDDDLDEHGRHITRRAPNRIGSLPFESRDSDEENNNTNAANIATYNYSPSVMDFDDFLAAEHQGNPSHLLRLAREQRERRERRENLRETPSSNQILHQLTRETQNVVQSRSQPSDTMAMSFAEALEAHNNATQEAVRAVGGELLAPHARFYIDKRSSTCSLTFDPPVSGRFILLKMWNSHHDPSSNIDIQTVMARGYAGGRYFPTVDFL